MPDEIHVGREGFLGIDFEDSPGSGGETPKKYLPWTACTLHNVVEVLDDEAAKGIRERAWGSVAARERGEGDITILLDAKNAPYLLYPGLGDIARTPLVSGVYKHTLTRKTGSIPTTICLNFNNVVDTRMFHYGTVNTLELVFSDGFAELTAGILTKKPTVGSGTRKITEEQVLAFKDASIQFGTDLTAAALATPTPLSAFTLTINNNAEAQFCSGSSSPAQISMGQFEAGGNYTLFFENDDEREAHELQTKRAMIVTFTGATLTEVPLQKELIVIKIPQFHITDRGVDTAPAGFVTENPTFVADYDSTVGVAKSISIEITNDEDHYGLESYSSSSSSSCSSSFSSSSSCSSSFSSSSSSA